MGNGWNPATKILVVDDDENNRKYYLQVLKRQGYVVDEASSGEQAVDFIAKNDYKLVLSDLQMYRLGGLDVLNAAKEKNPHTQVVILTGYGSIPTAVKAMQRGAYDYLSKPVKKDTFLVRVEKALEHYELQVRLQEQQTKLDAQQLLFERDLELAKTVQDSLVPNSFQNDRMAVAFEYHPMIGIGGDLCSIYQEHENHIHITMIDVTGHGISAALIVNRVYNELNAILKKDPQPRDVLETVNDFFYSTFRHMGLFLTMMSIQFDFSTRTLHYAGGAHPALLHYQPAHDVLDRLESRNTIIGFEESQHITFHQDSKKFHPGDRIILYTDGLLEAENEDKMEFGIQGLAASFKTHAEKPIHQACKSIIKDVQKFSVDAHRDDIMLMLVEIQ